MQFAGNSWTLDFRKEGFFYTSKMLNNTIERFLLSNTTKNIFS